MAAAFCPSLGTAAGCPGGGERQRAVSAQSAAADRWTPAPASLELGLRGATSIATRAPARVDVGVAISLWLPGERGNPRHWRRPPSALAGRRAALRLQLAQALRDAWWQWQLSQNEAVLANGRGPLPGVCATMSRRYQAGDLARRPQPGRRAPGPGPGGTGRSPGWRSAGRYRLESLTGLPAAESRRWPNRNRSPGR